MDDNRYSKLEDDLQNFWAFVKLEARRLSLLAYKVEQIEKTLSEILADNRQRSDSEETDK
jgi:hypothetical protein